jgi:hypothetical protein
MNDAVHCAAVRHQLAMLLYGELSFDEEERVETHLDQCGECREALRRQRALHQALDHVEIAPPASLLRECREDLRARLFEQEALPMPARSGWWERLVDAITLSPSAGLMRSAGALTLIAIGFFAARVLPAVNFGGRGEYSSMGLADSSRVRNVEPIADGRVKIVLDETRQRMISGRLDDDQIRALLLSAAKDSSDPGLRAETVDIFTSRAQTAEFRDALIFAVEHDQNAGVRMKALEGLTSFVVEPAVQSALEQVLLSDLNPGLRTRAIDVLIGSDGNGMDRNMDRQMIGTLQELMERGEQLGYVRERCRRVLESMNASIETY